MLYPQGHSIPLRGAPSDRQRFVPSQLERFLVAPGREAKIAESANRLPSYFSDSFFAPTDDQILYRLVRHLPRALTSKLAPICCRGMLGASDREQRLAN